jgi:hypothetical protein
MCEDFDYRGVEKEFHSDFFIMAHETCHFISVRRLGGSRIKDQYGFSHSR